MMVDNDRLREGHYTSYCYNDEGDTWEHYNDSKVHIVMREEVEGAEPYLLFYEIDAVEEGKENDLNTTQPFFEDEIVDE